ncbi:MAG TPA: hypothetical protein VMZ28_05030 [Kofleriaceae bacterium]|nr:hypothetical protein [Kofleriaceae bacterium]
MTRAPRARAPMIAAAVLLLAAAPRVARADDVPRVGVVVAVHVNLNADEASALGGALGVVLREVLVVDVVAGDEAQRRLPEGGVEELCLTRPECVRDIAARLNADQLLFLVAVRLGTRVQIDPTWTNADGSQTVSRDAIVFEKDRPPRDQFMEAAAKLLPDARRRPPGQPVPPPDTRTADAGGSAAVDATLASPPVEGERGFLARIHTGTWIAGGVAVVALGGGIAFGLSARSADHDLDQRGCDTMACDPDDVDALERKMLLADVLYGTAVVAAGAAVAIQLVWGGRDDEPPPVAVTGGQGGAGVAYTTRF